LATRGVWIRRFVRVGSWYTFINDWPVKYSELLKITLLALLVFIGGVALGNRFAEVLGMGEPLIFGTVNATVIDQ